ncbi:hypothetical protein AQUCO_02600349v1 [Aquilegia coerulea]|uniref:F-box domain-containing protein n=1 Tax=Aquilegia coerulea TaxID=218851 RepID=A0A2G5D8I7_AQUCA|nr:hypothetical protein AQUCO_02600349v1 [Aquilegia coerulea]PIA39822.1 hypothetical protein AQUCO_02600349v1 [Aquilegia coerulea]
MADFPSKDLLPSIPTSSSSSSSSSIFTQQWSQLPKDLLDSITNLLNLDDLFRFSYVCKTWNLVSSSLLPPNLNTPFLITPHEEIKHSSTSKTVDDYPTWNKTLGFFSLYNGKNYNVDVIQMINRRICGSCNGGWLVTVHGNGEIQVLHPFSKIVIDLPPIAKLPNVISSYDKEKKELSYTVPLKLGQEEFMKEINSDWMRDSYVYKVIMSCSDVNKGIVMALQGFRRKLAFCRVGKDKKWTIVNGDDNARLADVTIYQGKFYTVRSSGQVFVVEGMENLCPTIKSFIRSPTHLASDKYYLVESLGKLLLVTRSRYEPEVDCDLLEEDSDPISYETTSFTVYRLDFNGPKWVEVSNLGKDRALFVGFNQSFSLKTSDFPGCKGNCIYFTDDYVDHCLEEPVGGHDIGVYNLASGIVQKCYPTDALVIKPSPIWFTTHSY